MSRDLATGIVLAGGRSTRFGGDKLAALVDGEPLLHRAIRAVAMVVDEVVVAVGAGAASPPLPHDLTVPMVVVRDDVAGSGPLVGLDAGLAIASHPLALLVGGDQPTLRPALLAELLHRISAAVGESSPDIVALAEDGVLRPLPAAVRVATARSAASTALAEGARSLRALFDRVVVEAIEPAAWRAFDPDGASLRDVDTPADLPGTSGAAGSADPGAADLPGTSADPGPGAPGS